MKRVSVFRRFARSFVPPSWRLWLRSIFGWRWFRGNYSSWAEARKDAVGYEDTHIVAQVLQATRQVRAGEAAFERDGMTFTELVPDEPLVAALQRIRTATGGHLRVLDFGGALGSSYWRNRAWLESASEFQWAIVEQPAFVEAGRTHFADTPLRFFGSIEEAFGRQDYDVLLASVVVQYLEEPTTAIANWIAHRPPWILLNSVPLHSSAPDRIAVQHVPPSIYPASYPVRFFNREKFLAQFEATYDLIDAFSTEAIWPLGWRLYPSTGLLFRLRPYT